MLYRVVTGLALCLLVLGLSVSGASAAEMKSTHTMDDCAGMHDMMTREQMLADIQGWTAALPGRVGDQIVRVARTLSADDLMALHHAFHCEDLLSQSPRQIVATLLEIAK